MLDSLANFLGGDSFMPHGHCYYWKPAILWSYVASDILIALAYYAIPIALIYFVQKRKDLEFNWIFIMFSAFIFACGTTHLISIWTIWQQVYWLDVSAKGFTAIISVVTSIMLWRLMPQALSIPGTQELKDTVAQLRHEISERQQAEVALAHMKNSLELRVEARTAELLEINKQLANEIDTRKQAEVALFTEKQRAVITLESIGD
ncbi:MAG TPA: GGDEF domain-containing protein, partial [Methylophilus sp.]